MEIECTHEVQAAILRRWTFEKEQQVSDEQ
jgi:hypothetical protein